MTPDGRPFEQTLDDFIEITELDESGPVQFGPFAIECRRTIHPVPTFALRIGAGGRTLGLSSDTAFDPDLIAWLAGADVIVHEANRGIHTAYEQLVALPEDVRRKLRLTHYADDFDTSSSAIEPLVPGRIVSGLIFVGWHAHVFVGMSGPPHLGTRTCPRRRGHATRHGESDSAQGWTGWSLIQSRPNR